MEAAINIILMVLGIVFTVAIPLAILGIRLREGLWSNTVCLCNITFASLVAVNYFEPVASLLSSAWAGALFFYDFFSFWLLFTLSFFILNYATNRLSRVKVHFPKVLEQVGNGFALLGVLGNFSACILFSLPAAPFQPPKTEETQAVTAAEVLGRKARILSQSSLAPFTGENVWTAGEDYYNDQLGKRWALYSNVLEKKTFTFDGTVPPKRGANN